MNLSKYINVDKVVPRDALKEVANLVRTYDGCTQLSNMDIRRMMRTEQLVFLFVEVNMIFNFAEVRLDFYAVRIATSLNVHT